MWRWCTLYSEKENLFFLNFSDHYKYVYNGGCASTTQLYPIKIKSKKVESVELCYELCRDTENCAYFEYDSSAYKLCHLHPTGITRGNGYPSVICYKMEGDLNQWLFLMCGSCYLDKINATN